MAQEETRVVSNELEAKFARAKDRVDAYLEPYGGRKLEGRIKVDETLDMYSLAAHCYPDVVLVKSADIAESIIAHEWVHVVQGTLEYFRGFRLLDVLLAEGLAEFVTKELYPDHVVKYLAGYELVATLVASDPEVIGGLLQLNNLPLIPEDVDTILASAHVPSYSRDLIARMADRIRDSIRTANEVGIDDPTFVTLGEEVRAWKFILDQRFDGIRDRLDGATKAWFEEERKLGKKARITEDTEGDSVCSALPCVLVKRLDREMSKRTKDTKEVKKFSVGGRRIQ